jgi:hypothetical protein
VNGIVASDFRTLAATGAMAVVLLACGTAHAQVAAPPELWPRDVLQWVEAVIPPSNITCGPDWWEALNDGRSEWCVSVVDGRVTAEPRDSRAPVPGPRPAFVAETEEFRAPTSFLQVDDGWLVGYDHGEFGGALYWFSTDGTHHDRISDHQVVQFLRTPDGILAIEGCAHGGGRFGGSLVRIARAAPDARWLAPTLAELPSTPRAIVRRADGTLFIVLADGVAAVEPGDKLRILFRDERHADLCYVSSCVLTPDGQRLYVGLRQLVAQIELDACRMRLLAPQPDFLRPMEWPPPRPPRQPKR